MDNNEEKNVLDLSFSDLMNDKSMIALIEKAEQIDKKSDNFSKIAIDYSFVEAHSNFFCV
jgi:hypothetical protein